MVGTQLLFAKYAPHEAQTMTTTAGTAAANPCGTKIRQAIVFAASRFGDTAFSALLITTAVRGGVMNGMAQSVGTGQRSKQITSYFMCTISRTPLQTYKHTHTRVSI